jgi:hypothetical protein
VAIADAYDAMVNDRPYKRAITHEAAVEELRQHAGTQFDPELVALFCDLFASTAPQPDRSITPLTAQSPARDRRVAERAASAADQRHRASRPMHAAAKAVASGGEITMGLGGRPGADRTDPNHPSSPEARGRATG